MFSIELMQSRWIFMISQATDSEVLEAFTHRVEDVLQDWKTHGESVLSKVSLIENRLLVVEALSETSGCSIDWLNQSIYWVAKEFGISFLPNHFVFYQTVNGWDFFDFKNLEGLIENQELHYETLIIDNQSILSGKKEYILPIKDTWLSRYFQIKQ